MKLVLIAALALVAAVAAAPVDSEPVPIVRSEYDQQADGGYAFGFETGDGTKRDETGELKTVNDAENKPQTVVISRGTYSYVDPEGKPHSYTYYADEDGFHVEGEDVPQPPK